MTDQSILKNELKAQWEAMAEDWISQVQDGETSHREAMLDDWMLDAVGDVSGRKVVDLGCGEGRFSRILAERGAVVTGVDLCRPFIEFANGHRFSSEAYLIGDMEDLHEAPGDEFDPRRFIRDACRRPGHTKCGRRGLSSPPSRRAVRSLQPSPDGLSESRMDQARESEDPLSGRSLFRRG